MDSVIPVVFLTGFVAQVLAMIMYRPRPPMTTHRFGFNLNRLPKRSDYLSPFGWWSQVTAFAAIAATLILSAVTVVLRVW